MKKAYVDITFEALADLLRISFDPNRCEITSFEQSPKYENCIRLHISGDRLPVEELDEPQPITLDYNKGWVEKEHEGKTFRIQEFYVTVRKPNL